MTRNQTVLASALFSLWIAGCSAPPVEEAVTEEESWAVTAWGDHYEIFPEVDPLVTGQVAVAHTHVTRLSDFAPLVDGAAEIVLSGPSGEQVFRSETPVRPGIFNIEIRPEAPGDADLFFRITEPGGSEEIYGGRVRVSEARTGAARKGEDENHSEGKPETLLQGPEVEAGTDGGEPLSFLKEQQWRTAFSTAWVSEGLLARSVSGLARLRPPAGGEASMTSPVDGVLHPPRGSETWPFPGQKVDAGASLFRVVPRVAADESLPALESERAILEAEVRTARARLTRLEELLQLEATSEREVEEARALVETLEARRTAAIQDLASAKSSRTGGTGGGFTLRAPFSGEIATVAASPGATVEAGDGLARLVRTDSLWIEVALQPKGARQVVEEGLSGVVLRDGENPPIRIDKDLQLVSAAPEVSAITGTVAVLLAVPSSPGLTLGTTLEAQVLLQENLQGVVIPSSALVDDGGVPVVYLQLSGESFGRQAVTVLDRQGDLLLVDGLKAGQRLVHLGGEALRRSSLMSSNAAEGHVH